jgi:hypothetical protein
MRHLKFTPPAYHHCLLANHHCQNSNKFNQTDNQQNHGEQKGALNYGEQKVHSIIHSMSSYKKLWQQNHGSKIELLDLTSRSNFKMRDPDPRSQKIQVDKPNINIIFFA